VESARSVISEEVPFVIRLERDETILPIKINATFELNDNEVKQLSKKLIKQLPNIKQNSNDLFELKNSYTFTFENEKLTIVESSLSSQMETDYNKELPYSVKTNYENGGWGSGSNPNLLNLISLLFSPNHKINETNMLWKKNNDNSVFWTYKLETNGNLKRIEVKIIPYIQPKNEIDFNDILTYRIESIKYFLK